MQQQSNTVCGRPEKSGGVKAPFASVKAYRGGFSTAAVASVPSASVEFETDIPPRSNWAQTAKWPEGLARVVSVIPGELCCIDVRNIKVVP